MKKKIFYKIFSFFMIFCMAFVCVGCMGSTPGDYGDTDFEDTITLDMYGVKVLYRPDSYDFNTGSGGTAEEENIYYGKYAYQIMNALYGIYAIPNTGMGYIGDYATQFLNEKQKFLPYLYDSVRYKVDTTGNVDSLQINDSNYTIIINGDNIQIYKDGMAINSSTEEYQTYYNKYSSVLNGFSDYYLVGANTSAGWNFSFDYDSENLNSYLNYYEPLWNSQQPLYLNNHIYGSFLNENNYASNIATNFYNTNTSNLYQSYFLSSSNSPSDYDAYSQFTKALEYVIYSYALDLEPAQITINRDDTEPYYSVNVSGIGSVDIALEYIQGLFDQLGSYVGLVDRQITKIKNWIVENIIGPVAYSNDNITMYDSVTEVRTYKSDGTYERSYVFNASEATTEEFGRRYSEVVDAIVDGVCELVDIGKDGDNSVNIDERFLASEIREYAGNTFMISEDSNFPKYEEGPITTALLPLDYQSAVIMLSQPQFVENVYIALKYDADNSGTNEGEFGSEYIEIQVDLNYYSNKYNVYCTLSSEVVKVYDGPYDLDYMPVGGENGSGDGVAPADHSSGVEFSDIGKMWKDNPYGTCLYVGSFNPYMDNKILMTKEMQDTNYNGTTLVSKTPIVLIGSTKVKNYYSIVESSSDETFLDDSHTYVTGRLNHEMFAGTDGCDYLEITYKVLKEKGNTDKNYTFYTGIAFIDSSDKYYG